MLFCKSRRVVYKAVWGRLASHSTTFACDAVADTMELCAEISQSRRVLFVGLGVL